VGKEPRVFQPSDHKNALFALGVELDYVLPKSLNVTLKFFQRELAAAATTETALMTQEVLASLKVYESSTVWLLISRRCGQVDLDCRLQRTIGLTNVDAVPTEPSASLV